MPLRRVLGFPHFSVVAALLLIAQFLDRGLGLLIPLQVAQMPGVEKFAATAGAIVSIGAIAATTSANIAARLSRGIPAARLLLVGLLVGGPLCAAMALARGWLTLLVLRALAGLCLGAAITLTYSLGAAIVPAEHRGAAFGPDLEQILDRCCIPGALELGPGRRLPDGEQLASPAGFFPPRLVQPASRLGPPRLPADPLSGTVLERVQ